jgi:hypothetical protein
MATTVVSGYWIIHNKYKKTDFDGWFNYTLKVNCPYVFFGNKESIDLVKKYRGELPTYYIELEIKDFYTYKFKDTIQPHPEHCPSKELNMIWNEKVFLIQKAMKLNPFNSEWFAWLDAGIASYRNKSPSCDQWPCPEKLENLPKDKFIFTSSDHHTFDPSVIGRYYHYISGTFMMHKDFVDKYTIIYKDYMDGLLARSAWRYTDQVIHTIIYKGNNDLFYKLGDGYGQIGPLLEIRP